VRCKQCGTPVCGTCNVSGPTGNFCSETCRAKHEQFIRRAQELESRRSMVGWGAKIRRLVVKGAVLVVLVLFVAFLLTYFGVEVPVLSDQFRQYIDF
jgi:hypothetical protein